MTLFRELSIEEASLVKKWQPPRLTDSGNPTTEFGESQQQAPDSDDFTMTDITNLRNGVRDAQEPNMASNANVGEMQNNSNEEHGNHASLTMLGPSADILQQTYDEGFAAGAESEKSQPNEGAADMLFKLFENLTAQHYQIDAAIEQEVLLLAKAMAKLLLRREVESDDGVMIAIVRNALAQMPMTSETPSVVLHPDDLTIIEGIQDNPVLATLVSDPDMLRGDCRIESGASTLEAGIDALLASISSRINQPLQDDSISNDSETELKAQADK